MRASSSSSLGGWVLDPFFGYVCRCVAAEAVDREWIDRDRSLLNYTLIQHRFRNEWQYSHQGYIHRTDF